MGLDRKDTGPSVKMSNNRHLHAASHYAEGGVLEGLEFMDGGGASIREPVIHLFKNIFYRGFA